MAVKTVKLTAAEKVLAAYTKNSSALDTREKDIIERYYGFGNYTRTTLEEIAPMYQITRERVRQVKHMAVQKLLAK
jgi:DNA-directed RNA polymerase sigma subunit (sigma70/sigma32)